MALIHCDFFSEVLGLSCSMCVILPQQTRGQIGMAGTAGVVPAVACKMPTFVCACHTLGWGTSVP